FAVIVDGGGVAVGAAKGAQIGQRVRLRRRQGNENQSDGCAHAKLPRAHRAILSEGDSDKMLRASWALVKMNALASFEMCAHRTLDQPLYRDVERVGTIIHKGPISYVKSQRLSCAHLNGNYAPRL